MKRYHFSFAGLLLLGTLIMGQSDIEFPFVEEATTNKFVHCAAILYNDKVLVDTYSTAGKCRITDLEGGKLSVSTITFENNGMQPVQPINFRLAIRNEKSNTLWMYSEKLMKEIHLKDVLDRLEQDDKLIFMTTNDLFALPHHEVEINIGC